MSREYKWRTASSGVEGTATVYVDSYTGSDLYGDGTRANPYKSLTRAFNAKGNTKPTKIVCRGSFSEMLDGNHSTSIDGDYLGAAVFDGADQNVLYGFGHNNMIIRNIPAFSITSLLLAGVGRAINASFVGNAYSVCGVCGSSALLSRCAMYMGVIGNTYASAAASSYIVVARPQCNSSYRISVAGKSGKFANNTLYGCRIGSRQKHYADSMMFSTSIFADFDMIANEARNDTYELCLFTADCKWYYLTGNNTDSEYVELQLSGATSAERQASLLAALAAKYEEYNVPAAQRYMPTFNSCIFSTRTAAQILNDPENDDFTLIPGCEADTGDVALQGTAMYIGALPPAIRIPIMDDSEGHPSTWDEHSASGCLIIDNDRICIDTESASAVGEILSKVISINPVTTQINGVFANFASKFGSHYVYANMNSILGPGSYAAGETLPTGRYIVTDTVEYQEDTIAAYNVLVVTETGTSFTSSAQGARALELLEPNVQEVVYCRCRNAVYARATPFTDLQAGATYLNDSAGNITYHGRTVAPGESFVAMITGEHFTAAEGVSIAILFDDTRVPSVDWVPAQLFGEYFVAKMAGAIQKDANGVPLSSGNYNAYQQSGLLKSTMDRQFVQFAIKVKRYAGVAD